MPLKGAWRRAAMWAGGIGAKPFEAPYAKGGAARGAGKMAEANRTARVAYDAAIRKKGSRRLMIGGGGALALSQMRGGQGSSSGSTGLTPHSTGGMTGDNMMM